MLAQQCKHCGRHAYYKGRCYADNMTRGRNISKTIECGWATPQKSLSKKHLNNKEI